MKKLLYISLFGLLAACSPREDTRNEKLLSPIVIQQGDVMGGINLTVSEGKKLIALGIASHPLVKQKMKSGIIIITRGTTNTYIAEQLIRLDAPHGSFMTGNITPENIKKINDNITRLSEMVIIDGKVSEMDYAKALKLLKEDDIIFKGANMLNYERNQAAVCIGAPDGGTTARFRPYIGEGKARLIVPVGLEKEVPGDLYEYETFLAGENKQLTKLPKIWVHKGAEIFTEIEAIKTLVKVNVFPYAAGGIAGREGGISLIVAGEPNEVKKILDIVATIQGEKPFI